MHIWNTFAELLLQEPKYMKTVNVLPDIINGLTE